MSTPIKPPKAALPSVARVIVSVSLIGAAVHFLTNGRWLRSLEPVKRFRRRNE